MTDRSEHQKIEHTNDGGVKGCKGGYMETTCQDAHHVVKSGILQGNVVGQPPQAIHDRPHQIIHHCTSICQLAALFIGTAHISTCMGNIQVSEA
jgi:hypothetical protein